MIEHLFSWRRDQGYVVSTDPFPANPEAHMTRKQEMYWHRPDQVRQ
jgi:hypothetical protein